MLTVFLVSKQVLRIHAGRMSLPKDPYVNFFSSSAIAFESDCADGPIGIARDVFNLLLGAEQSVRHLLLEVVLAVEGPGQDKSLSTDENSLVEGVKVLF